MSIFHGRLPLLLFSLNYLFLLILVWGLTIVYTEKFLHNPINKKIAVHCQGSPLRKSMLNMIWISICQTGGHYSYIILPHSSPENPLSPF